MRLGLWKACASAAIFGSLSLSTATSAFAAAMGITPNFPAGSELPDVVGFRYRTRVNVNNSSTIKIVFGWKRFYNPNGDTDTYLLETNLYSNWLKYPDSACLGWPPNSPTNEYFSGQSGLWVSVPDYPKKEFVGVRQSDAATTAMFPRQNSGIDAISGLTKIETISQENITGKDIYVEYTRGGTFTTPLSGWGYRFTPDPVNPGSFICDPNLPAATYQIWIARATFDATTYQWEFALPASSSKYFAPWEIVTFACEFFNEPGLFQTYFWDLEVERESTSAWQPLLSWRVSYLTEPNNDGWGPKLGTYNGQTVIEISNDGTNTYYPLNAVFNLPEPPPEPDAGADAASGGSAGAGGGSVSGGGGVQSGGSGGTSKGGTSSGGTSSGGKGGASSGGTPSGGNAGSKSKSSNDDSGCGCRTRGEREDYGALALLGLSVAWLARRRRGR